MYFYNFLTNLWIQITPALVPSARANACISFQFPIFYLYGGENSNGILDDFWMYSLITQEFSLVSSIGFHPPGLTRAQCFYYQDAFYLFSGSINSYYSLGTVFFFNVTTQNWEIYMDTNDSEREYSNTQNILTENGLVQIGGSRTNTISSSIKFYNIAEKTVVTLGHLPDPVASHSIVHSGKNIYIFGGLNSVSNIGIPNIGTSRFYKITDDIFDCSPGNYGNECILCEPGYYNDQFNAESCTACPAGTYNSDYGATSLSQCIPCHVNTFADVPGSYTCKECPNSEDCPIGTSIPIPNTLENTQEIQPSSYDENRVKSAFINQIVIACIFAFAGVIILIYLTLRKLKIFARADIFKNLHPRKYYEEPFGTEYGGLISILFIIVSLVFILTPIVAFSVSNISEIKTLVPNISYRDIKIMASCNITLVLYNFNGECGVDGVCMEHMFYSAAGSYTMIGSGPFCYKSDNICKIVFISDEFSIETSLTSIFTVSDPLIYSTNIDATLSCTSSIPESISSTTISLSAPDSQVFNGFTPSYFSFYLIPSVLFN